MLKPRGQSLLNCGRMAKPSESAQLSLVSVSAAGLANRSLEACEEVIEAGLQTFYEVGQALAHIRDNELHKAGYITFQAYLKERWGFSFNYASRLIAGADVVKTLEETTAPPSSVGVAEELLPLPTALRQDIWQQALDSTKRVTNGRPNPTADEVHILVNAKLQGVSKSFNRVKPKPRLSDSDQRMLERVRAGETMVANLRIQTGLLDQAEEEGLVVRVDRGSRWGNPFILKEDGTRDEVITAYRDSYLPHKPSLRSRLGELQGKLLACWCAPEPCHGDVLAALANSRTHGDHD